MIALHPRPSSTSIAARSCVRDSGLTLVELVIATGLAALVMTALISLLDLSLDLWTRGETRRTVVEQATATADLMARDLRALHPGREGDLLVDWQPFDVDRDGVVDRVWPRLRLVRQASRADLARLAALELDADLVAEAREKGVDLSELYPDGPAAPEPPPDGWIAVAYCVVPAGEGADRRGEGVLLRGEELVQPGVLPAFFEPTFFSSSGQPRGGTMQEVTGGILWLGIDLATRTTILTEGWRVGDTLGDAATSWDAWGLGRPDAELSSWNLPGAGMPTPSPSGAAEPALPRRVRIELEFESERDRRRRTRLAAMISKGEGTLEVENGEALPTRTGSYVLVEEEWMEVTALRGDRFSVRRGQRGTEPREHAAGALVHWGEPVVVEVPIPTYRDTWRGGGAAR